MMMSLFLVVLADVLVCPVEQLLVRMELVLEQGAAKLFLHESLALGCMLPIRKPHFLNNLPPASPNL